VGVYGIAIRDKKVVGVFVRFSCAASLSKDELAKKLLVEDPRARRKYYDN
jgi:hypothetical protein